MAIGKRPTTGGVFIVWDEERVDVERIGVDTLRERLNVKNRYDEPVYARYTNEISPDTIAAAERYADTIRDQHANVRVEVIC